MRVRRLDPITFRVGGFKVITWNLVGMPLPVSG
jgi:hypothetical protein